MTTDPNLGRTTPSTSIPTHAPHSIQDLGEWKPKERIVGNVYQLPRYILFVIVLSLPILPWIFMVFIALIATILWGLIVERQLGLRDWWLNMLPEAWRPYAD